ncbi:SpoIIE family protein phosphatase [Saccharothrix hoggarensis]|uniref:SpoIIE family protein phosphatase n=1 Tax=Saccharothrix hoggarensis TaxID=913853 RepID=A0ABW3QUZ6_9PSEU
MTAPMGADLTGLVNGMGVVAWEADVRSRRLTFVSPHAEVLLGYPPEFWSGDLDSLVGLIHSDDRAEVWRAWRAGVLQDYFEVEFRATAADGRLMWLRCRVQVVHGDAGVPVRVRGMLADVTRRRTAEQGDRFLAALERELQGVDDAEEVMATVTRLLRAHLNADRCAYARVEDDEDHFVMSGDHATGLPPLRGRFAMSAFGEQALRAMRAGQPWVVVDALRDPRLTDEDRDAYRRTGIRAVVSVPLLRGGRFVAGLAVHQASVRHWTPAELEVITVVVHRCWESLQRVHADRARRESEQRYRLLVERATDAIWVLDGESRFVEVNPAACVLLGRTRDELVGTSVTDLVVSVPDGRASADVDAAGDHVVTEVWQVRRGDGTVIALELSIQSTPTGVQAIGRDVTERQRVEAERELLLRREHEIAAALQRSLLPRELPTLDRLAIAARYLPASTYAQIGGDWYDVLELDGNTVALCVGDVVGKGPSAAAVMGQLRSALAGYLLEGRSPAAALERLDVFARRVDGAAGSTCACLTLDRDTGVLRCATAGHPPPLVAHAETVWFLTGGRGPVLGAPGGARYVEHTVDLPVGASVVLYTDGLVEDRDLPIDDGLDRLLAVVRDARAAAPDALTDAVTDVLLVDGQDDDVALVVARYLPPPLVGALPAQPASLSVMRRGVEAWAAAAALSEDLLDDLQLALGEAAANVVDHAYPPGQEGSLEYEVANTATTVHVTVRDHGRWRPVPADPGYRGRGTGIIRTLAEQVVFEQGEAGTTVDFHLSLRPGVPAPPVRPEEEVTGLLDDPAGGTTRRVRLTGDLDLDTVREVRAPLLSRVGDTDQRPVDVDLTGLRYLGSSGIALLLDVSEAATRAGRALTVLVSEGSAPARALSVAGLDDGDLAESLIVRTVPQMP